MNSEFGMRNGRSADYRRDDLVMKKKLILILTCCLLIIAGVGGALLYIEKSTPKNGTLYVNDKEITSENVKIYSNYADLPLTEVMKALGMTVEWVDNSTADITYNDQEYTLDLAEVTLIHYGYDINFIMPAPGSTTFHYTVIAKEVVLDDNTIHSIMYSMKSDISISIDHKKSIVYVTEWKD